MLRSRLLLITFVRFNKYGLEKRITCGCQFPDKVMFYFFIYPQRYKVENFNSGEFLEGLSDQPFEQSHTLSLNNVSPAHCNPHQTIIILIII